MPSVEQLRNTIVEAVVKDFSYYRENPQHMAWAMMNFELLQRAGRVYFKACADNPKDVVIDAGNGLGSESDANLLYDAWGISVSNYNEFPDTNPNHPLEAKLNKTMGEWTKTLTNPKYVHHSLYEDKFSVKDGLLCVIGTGYGWNERGFIARLGPCGTDETIFAGYTRAEGEIPKEIKEKIIALREHPSIRDKVLEMLNETQENARRVNEGEDWMRVLNPNFADKFGSGETPSRKPRVQIHRCYYPLSETSNLLTMPNYAHKSYVLAGIDIAIEILNNPKEPKQSKRSAMAFMRLIKKRL